MPAAPKAATKKTEPEESKVDETEPTVEELGATLLQDKQATEPQHAIGGAEIAGAQLADNAVSNMIAGEQAEPVDD